jgi:hypothetical protein
MKANQFYRQWITEYIKEKDDRSGDPIQDGDLLDWIAEKFELGEFKQLNKPVVMQAKGRPCPQCEGIGRVVDDDFTGETIPCETCGGAAVGQRSGGTNAEGEELLCFCANGGREGLHGICTNCGNYVGSSREGHL